MYGKLFESCFTGSMYGSGPTVFAVWAWVIANANKSFIEINPKLLAPMLGTSEADVKSAVEFLCQPDQQSRNKEHEGCRLVREGEFNYFIPSWQHYHDVKSEEERREYMRNYMREKRAVKTTKVNKQLTQQVQKLTKVNCKQLLTPVSNVSQSEADTNTYKEPSGTSAFISAWCEKYMATWGVAYKFLGGRDGKAAKSLVAIPGETVETLLDIASRAWKHGGFWCKGHSATIHGFSDHFNEIRKEVGAFKTEPARKDIY